MQMRFITMWIFFLVSKYQSTKKDHFKKQQTGRRTIADVKSEVCVQLFQILAVKVTVTNQEFFSCKIKIVQI